MHNSHSRINDTEAWLSHSNALRLCHQTHHASLLALGSLQLYWIFGFKDMFSQYIRCKATAKCSLDCPVDESCLEIFIIHPQPWRLSQQVALVRTDSAFLTEWLFSLLYHYISPPWHRTNFRRDIRENSTIPQTTQPHSCIDSSQPSLLPSGNQDEDNKKTTSDASLVNPTIQGTQKNHHLKLTRKTLDSTWHHLLRLPESLFHCRFDSSCT
ncbi:hypothetical protein BJ166DRAFT_193878 [Pestalotiopsis sp. NC0098]|nr:hypothetical protein BJ166DRAFT_193878 [Pestalotiopsis sp. NC0098]